MISLFSKFLSASVFYTVVGRRCWPVFTAKAVSPRRLSSLFCGLLLWSNIASAAVPPIPNLDEIPIPRDMGRVHFYLISVDVGDKVWDNFGHTALRLVDEASNTDIVFNWGGFDASGGVVAFSFDFFKGIMNYTLQTSSPDWEFANYERQQRTVWQDKINLSNSQKALLFKRLSWNLQPENIVYPYHYFFDNCTTRVRDYLDEALGGQIRRAFIGQSDQSFREQVQNHYASVGVVALSLDILMNSNIDRLASEWEEMFLPLTFRARLQQLPSDVAIAGVIQPLLSESQIINAFPRPVAEVNPFETIAIVLLGSVLLLLILLKKVPMSFFATHSGISLKFPAFSFRLLGLMGLLTAIPSGIYGSLMLGSWFISDHLDLHHNVNLLLFWPTDLLGVVVALRWLFLCKPWPMTHNSAPFISYYLLAHLAGIAVYAAVGLLGLSSQQLQNILYYIVPGFFLYTVVIWLVGFQAAKPKNVLV